MALEVFLIEVGLLMDFDVDVVFDANAFKYFFELASWD